MKIIRPQHLGALLAAITVVLVGCAGYTSTEPLAIRIDHFHGDVRYSMDENIWRPLTNKVVIKEGMTIQTGNRSHVDISFGKKPARGGPFTSHDELVYVQADPSRIVHVYEKTSLKIEKAVKKTRWYWAADTVREEIRLNLGAGEIIGEGGSACENSKYEIEFTNGLATFSNKTFYMLTASGNLYVVKGNANIFMTDKNTSCEVSTHQTFDSGTGIIGELTTNQIHGLSMIRLSLNDEMEWVTQPPTLGHGPGMGGALRKF